MFLVVVIRVGENLLWPVYPVELLWLCRLKKVKERLVAAPAVPPRYVSITTHESTALPSMVLLFQDMGVYDRAKNCGVQWPMATLHATLGCSNCASCSVKCVKLCRT